MKKLVMALLLAVILTVTLAAPAFAGPPPDAGKGTAWNDGLGNAWNHLEAVFYKTGTQGALWAWAIVDYLQYPSAGPPPWFAPANYK